MRNRFLHTAFFLIFAFYAVSPLSHRFGQKIIGNSFASEQEEIFHQLNIFVWELICAKIVPKGDFPLKSSVNILFIKARAILSNEDIKKTKPLDHFFAQQGMQFFIVNISRSKVSRDNSRTFLQKFLRYYGLSPPTA